MKKNFFKKLSFVMALAMLITCLAPAAGVFAAAKPALSYTSKVLHLSGEPSSNEYDFWVKNKQSGWKYAWSSNNENVAVVDNMGLTTAVGVGTAKVTVKITKAGKAVATLSAKVTVLDNIKTVTVANPTEKSLKVNEEYDFNRNFETLTGSTTRTSSITRWTVDSDKATVVSTTGVFKATEAGEYKVTATAFQSSYTYGLWTKTKDDKYVLDTDVVTVKVDPSIVATTQTTLTKFTVEFDSDMSKTDIATKAVVYKLINGKQVASGTEKIKSLKLDEAGKVTTVEMYTELNEETEYNFVYGDLVGAFTSADVDLADVASIEFADTTANINGTASALLDSVVAKDKNGVVIFTGDADSTSTTVQNFNATVTFALDSSADLTKTYLDTSSKVIYVYSKGYSVPVTATFTYYVYNTTTKVYDTITWKDSAMVTGVETDVNLNTATIQYAASSTGKPATDSKAWSSAITVAAGDTGNVLYTRYKNNDATSTTDYTVDETSSRFSYTSSNEDKLIINGQYMYPISSGVVTVIVKDKSNDNKVVGTFDVTIMASRSFATATIDTSYVSVSNNVQYGANGTANLATITVKDSMGVAPLTPATGTASLQTGPSNATAPIVTVETGTGDDNGKLFVRVEANAPATAGAYNFKVTVNALGTSKDLYITVLVVEGQSNLTVTSWRLDLGSTSFDLKEVATAKPVSIIVAGYNSNNVKVAELDATQYYDVTITKDGTAIDASRFNDTTLTVVSGTSGSALSALATGTYVVTAKATGTANPTGKVAGAVLGTATFTLTDTTTKSVVVANPVVATGSVLSMVKNAFTFYLNGTALTDTQEGNIVAVTYYLNAAQSTDASQPIAAGTSIYITEVTYKVDNADGTDTLYKFTPNANVKAQ